MELSNSTIAVRSREAAKRVLTPYLEAIGDCLYVGFHRWKQGGQAAPELFAPLSARTRSCFVYDHICYEVIRRFTGVDKVRWTVDKGFLVLIIEDALVVRFKKLDRRGRVRYIPTHQSTMYFLQEELPGFPLGVLRLNAGYQLNELQTDIANMLITYQVGRDVEWSFPVLQTTVEITSFTASGPTSGAVSSAEAPRKPRVRPRSLLRKEAQD